VRSTLSAAFGNCVDSNARTPNLTYPGAKLMSIRCAAVACLSRGQRKRDPLGRVPVVRFCGAGPRGGCDWPLTHLHAVGARESSSFFVKPGRRTSNHCGLQCISETQAALWLAKSMFAIHKAWTTRRLPCLIRASRRVIR
jgi:hypothetical protein